MQYFHDFETPVSPKLKKEEEINLDKELGSIGLNLILPKHIESLLLKEIKMKKEGKAEQKYELNHLHCSRYICYYAGRFVIIYDPVKEKQYIYNRHKHRISCVATFPSSIKS